MISAVPLGSAPQRTLRGTGPALVVLIIVVAAAMGYYQIVYYPSHAPTTTSLTRPLTYDPHNVTVTILSGAGNPGTARDKTFSPNLITVTVGFNATVFWINNDTVLHTVTANASDPDPAFVSFGPTSPPYNNINAGASLNYTFTMPGTYGYFCSYHSWMIGTVIVKPGNGTSASGSSTGASTSGIILHVLKSQVFFLAKDDEATDFANSLATLTGSGIAP
jgi:plastocyanin